MKIVLNILLFYSCFEKLYKCYTDILSEDVSNNLAKEIWNYSEMLSKKRSLSFFAKSFACANDF
jgi:hypothetical protein